ncbi:hypothetical protein ACFQDE_12685 [Deinococcus caeni]
MTHSTQADWLRRRNALWQRLRALPPPPAPRNSRRRPLNSPP